MGILIALVLICLVLLALPPGESLLKGVAESQLSQSLGQQVTIGKLRTNLLSRVDVRDIRIAAANDPGSSPVLQIDNVEVHYSFWSLLHREISLEYVNITGGRIHIERDSSGRFNVALLDSLTQSAPTETRSTSRSASGFKVTVTEATLSDFDTDYKDDLLGTHAWLLGLSAGINSNEANGYAGKLVVDSTNVAYHNRQLGSGNVTAGGHWQNQTLTVDSLYSVFAGLHLTGSGSVPFDDSSEIDFHVSVTGNPNRLISRFQGLAAIPEVNVAGPLNLNANFSGDISNPIVDGHLTIPSATSERYVIDSATLAARWQDDTITIDSLDVTAFAGEIKATGSVYLDSVPQVSINLDLANLDIRRLWTTFSDSASPYGGKLSGQVALTGGGFDFLGWEVQAQLKSKQTTYQHREIADLDAEVSLHQGVVTLNLTHEFLNAHVKALATTDSLRGTFAIDVKRLRPLAAFLGVRDLSGSMTADGTLSGSMSSPGVVVDAQGESLYYRNLPIDEFNAKVAYQDSSFRISRLTASGAVNDIDPSKPPLELYSLSGGFKYDLSLAGSLNDLTGKCEATLTAPGYSDVKFDYGHVIATIDGDRLSLSEAELRRDSLTLQLEGEYNLDDNKGRLSLIALPIGRNGVAATTNAGSVSADFDISNPKQITLTSTGKSIELALLGQVVPDSAIASGILNYNLNFAGSLTNPDASLIVEVHSAHYAQMAVDSITASLRLKNRTFDLRDLTAFIAGQKLTAAASATLVTDSTGALTIDERSHVEGRVQIPELDLSMLQPFLPEATRISGRGSAHLSWNGTLSDPNVSGRCSLADVNLVPGADNDSITNMNLELNLADSVIRIDSADGLYHRQPFHIDGTVVARSWRDFRADLTANLADIGAVHGHGTVSSSEMDLTASADSLDLSVLQPFLPDLDTLTGRLDTRITAKGSFENPQVRGHLHVSGLALKLSEFSQGVDHGVASIYFAGDSVRIDTLLLRQGDGFLFANGTVTVAKGSLADIDLSLTVDDVAFGAADEYTVVVDTAEMAYRKEKDLFFVRGNVVLGESRLTMNLEPESILPWAQTVVRQQSTLPAFLQQTRFDFRIKDSDQLWIDNNLAHIRMRADLGVIGTPDFPNFTGRLSIEEGYLLYLDRKFKVDEGVVYFTDPSKLNPDITLKAQTQVTSYQGIQGQSYLITISVQGKLDQLQVQLSSDPALDNPDIVSMLTLGATRNQLTSKEGGGQTVLLRRAETLTSNKISGFVGGRFESLLGLDKVSVEGNLFNPERSNGIQLLAAKQITNRARITYTTTVGQLNEQSIRLDYKLSHHFSFEGETNRQGDARISFKYGLLFQ
jgi:autotransporter translocation and assembly factor TamB